MTAPLAKFSPWRRHARVQVLSGYLEGELRVEDRIALEAHFRGCARCQHQLASLATTVSVLGSLKPDAPAHLADSIIAALRSESPLEPAASEQSPRRLDAPALTVVAPSARPLADQSALVRWSRGALGALRYCLRRPQLRLTVPIALLAGVVLTVVNMGGTLVAGRIDLRICAMCAMDFLVPFVALNIVLLLLMRIPGRRRL